MSRTRGGGLDTLMRECGLPPEDPWLREPHGFLVKPDLTRHEQSRSHYERDDAVVGSQRRGSKEQTSKAGVLASVNGMASRGGFHRRYFQFERNELSYYRGLTDKARLGAANLRDVEDVRLSRVEDAPSHALDFVAADRVFTIGADTRAELAKWALAICSRIAELETADALASNQHVACWKPLDDCYERPCDVSLRLARAVGAEENGWERGLRLRRRPRALRRGREPARRRPRGRRARGRQRRVLRRLRRGAQGAGGGGVPTHAAPAPRRRRVARDLRGLGLRGRALPLRGADAGGARRDAARAGPHRWCCCTASRPGRISIDT